MWNFKHQGIWSLAALMAVFNLGCESTDQDQPEAPATSLESPSTDIDSAMAAQDPGNEATEQTAAEMDLSERTWTEVSRLYNQAKESGQTSASNASQWLSDMWDSTAAGSADISKQSQQWLMAQYLKAKEAGTTSANSVGQYFQDELSKVGAWEYQVQLGTGDASAIQAMLNQSGRERWECFSVTDTADGQMLYYRRRMKSDFDNIPTRDLMRILMTVAGAGILNGGESAN